MNELLQFDQTADAWMHPSEETWKPKHDEAMACRDIEDGVRLGLALLTFIDVRQRTIAEACVAGNRQPSAEVETALHDAYQAWMRTAERYTHLIERFSGSGYAVEVVGEFRQACARVRSLLTLWSKPMTGPSGNGISMGDMRARVRRQL